MNKKPIYGGRIDSDHEPFGKLRVTIVMVSLSNHGDSKTRVHWGAAQDMDLFLHPRPLS